MPIFISSRKVPLNLEVNKLAIAGFDESASASAETQNYTEPYVEEPLADEEWLQNYREESIED